MIRFMLTLSLCYLSEIEPPRVLTCAYSRTWLIMFEEKTLEIFFLIFRKNIYFLNFRKKEYKA